MTVSKHSVTACTLSPVERVRYGRQVLLPQVGLEGQERLRRARVLVVGVGGLGCPAALYLAAGGVGRIGLADFDAVDAGNLQRQVLYRDADIGRPKVEAAARALRTVNPHVDVGVHAVCVDGHNASELAAAYDMVLDGCDNPEARYALNAACVAAGKPYIYGSVYQFEGQVSVFGLPGDPCYACLFPTAAPGACTCAQAGVLGVAPGVIGTLQAAEAVKVALGTGDLLHGKLLVCDLLGMRFETFEVPRDAACDCCGSRTVSAPDTARPAECRRPATITPDELDALLELPDAVTLLDVGDGGGRNLDVPAGVVRIPLAELPARLEELPRDRAVVVCCLRGVRSAAAATWLLQAGFTDVRHLAGGWLAWGQTRRGTRDGRVRAARTAWS